MRNTKQWIEKNGFAGISFEKSDGKRETMESVLNRFMSPVEMKKTELERQIHQHEMDLRLLDMSPMTEFNMKVQLDKLKFALDVLQTL